MKSYFLKINYLIRLFISLFTIEISAQEIKNTGFPKFIIGDIECYAISDGFAPLPAQPSIAPRISKAILSEKLKDDFRTDSIIDYPLNILLLKKGDRLILIDAGQGSIVNKNAGQLIGNLKLLGITPLQITDIIISHAHTDHIDGLIDEHNKSVFRNAKIYISQVEYDFWMGIDDDFGKSIKNVFSIIQPQMELIDDGAIIYDCIRSEIVPGHTPGHLICVIFSGKDKLVAINDLVIDKLILTYPDWGSGFDNDFEQAIESRKNILRLLWKDRSIVWGTHLPYPGVGYIKRVADESYEWNSMFLSTPQNDK